MPLSEPERDAIVERLRIEQDLRKELTPKSEDHGSKWWESKVALLVIGSVLTSLVVPWLQYTQKNFEWKRQNQFDNSKYRLDKMREGLAEFIVLSAFVGEGYERSRPILFRRSIPETEQRAFETQFIDLQNRRFRQNAKVVSLMIHFRRTTALRDSFQEYLVGASAFFRLVEDTVRARAAQTAPADEADIDKVDKTIQLLEGLYTEISNRMIEEIGRMEDENEKYRL
jgi:hypothetical protein